MPPDLDLTFLHGAELIQVCLGVAQVQLHFHPTGSLCVEGQWELFDAVGVRIDGATRPCRPHTPHHLPRLLGQMVSGSAVSAPDWFSLQFAGGEVLRVYDDSPQYESFQIEPGGIVV